jgi:hypothetical protein
VRVACILGQTTATMDGPISCPSLKLEIEEHLITDTLVAKTEGRVEKLTRLISMFFVIYRSSSEISCSLFVMTSLTHSLRGTTALTDTSRR